MAVHPWWKLRHGMPYRRNNPFTLPVRMIEVDDFLRGAHILLVLGKSCPASGIITRVMLPYCSDGWSFRCYLSLGNSECPATVSVFTDDYPDREGMIGSCTFAFD